MPEQNHKLEDMIRTSLESIRTMVDANTVVGTPIETASGTTIIPISKVSVGYASGGMDFDGKHPASLKNFAGSGGTGVSVQPVCFLAVDAEGGVEVLPLVTISASDSVEKLAAAIDYAPELLERLKELFAKIKLKKDVREDIIEEVAKDAAETTENVKKSRFGKK